MKQVKKGSKEGVFKQQKNQTIKKELIKKKKKERKAKKEC